MKYIKADLLDDVVGTYDQTKTTIQGRVAQKTISGEDVLGPPLSNFIDVFQDTGLVPNTIFSTSNDRLFVTVTPVNGTSYDLMPILLYNFNYTTGAYSYVGRIDIQLPNLAASVHTVRGFKVIDTGTTGWKLFIATSSTVLINGGLFVVNDIALSDFIPIGHPTIPMATASAQKAVYLLQDPANIGVNQLNTVPTGIILDEANNAVYVHNGVAATHQFYRYTTSTPTYVPEAVSVSVASPGIVTHVGHTFNNNDPVIFTTGTLPTGLVVGQPYFVRNPTATTYQLSATSGGASINTTGSPSVGAEIGRAWGTTGSNFVYKTGNLPALTGTLLQINCEYKATPVNSPINGGVLNGNDCAFFATSSRLYLGLLSELTSATTSWPSLSNSDLLGGLTEITAPTAINASWSNFLDSATYVTNTSKFIVKQLDNGVIQAKFGELNNQYYETTSPLTISMGITTAPTSVDHENGWLFVGSSTTGQRGILFMDMRSDSFYDFSFIVSKVLDTTASQMQFITSLEQLWEETGNIKVQYRTSGFSLITGGWTDIQQYTDLSSIATYDQIQFKILFNVQSEESSSPAQISELILGLEDYSYISNNWEFSDDFSDNTVPSRCAFRLKQTYATSVPTLYFRARDLSNVLLVAHNTITNAANFEYSTDNGVSWLPLGTIPNTVGTLLRYSFTSPPGVDIRPSIRED